MKNKFTLIEIVIAILVVSLLAAIVLINVSNAREKAIISMISSNIKNIQTAVDLYYLENNEAYPTGKSPTIYNPQYVDFNKLTTDYLKKGPDYNKLENQYYWVDYTGKVWGSTVKPIKNYYQSPDFIEWYSPDDIIEHNYYNVSEGYNKQKIVKFTSKIDAKGNVSVKIPNQNRNFLLSNIDSYGFETAPAGLGYNENDWFKELIKKEGTFTFEFSSRDTMYWDDFWTLEHKPQGTDIQYRFSTMKENGEWSEWVNDFYSLKESKSIKIEVTMIGNNNAYPSLIDMKIDYHFRGEVVWYFDLSSKPKEVYPEEIQEEILKEDVLVYEINIPRGEKVKEISLPNGINPESVMIFTPEGENVQEITELKKNKTYYVIGEKSSASHYLTKNNSSSTEISDFYINEGVKKLIVHTSSKEIQSVIFKPNQIDLEEIAHIKENEKIKDIKWTTIDAFNLFFNSDTFEEVDWTSAVISDLQPENTRILYFYTPSIDKGWGVDYDNLENVPNSRALRVTVVLQVKTEFMGIADNPEFYSMKIGHESGSLMPSPYKDYVMIYPKKLNDLNLKGYFTSTIIDWNYTVHSNSQITDIEWKGNKENYNVSGEYQVDFRYKTAKTSWSQWYSQTIIIKDIGLKPNTTDVPAGWIGISTVEEFMRISVDVNYPRDGKYILLDNLDFSNVTKYTPKRFDGTFNGNGLSIDNITIVNNKNKTGIFSEGPSPHIHDLYIRNANVKGMAQTGALIGFVGRDSKIERIGVINSKIEGNSYTGGIVGVSEWSSTSNSNQIKQTFVYKTDVKATLSNNVGGIVGVLSGSYGQTKLENNYALYVNIQSDGILPMNLYYGGIAGDIFSAYEDYNYAVVSMPDKQRESYYVGALFGWKNTSTSYYNKEMKNAYAASNSSSGRTEEQMMKKSTYKNWDFNAIWAIDEGKSYPYFQWQVPLEDLEMK